MHDDRLKTLLERAEEGLASPGVPGDLAGRVRTLDSRRRGRKRVLTIVAPAALMLCTYLLQQFSVRWQSPEPAEVAGAVAIDRETVERLEAEAAFHRRVAQEIVSLREQDKAKLHQRPNWSEPEPQSFVREQLEMAAYRMILRAEALQAAMRPQEESLAVYRDIVRLFPETASAQQARERLSRLGQS